MSVVRFFVPENRLGKAIQEPGGKKIVDAIADAEQQILLAAGECAAQIDLVLDEIFRACVQPAGPTLEQLYPLSREVAGLAGIAELPDLGLAAHTFCSLIDLGRRNNGLNEDQIQVNVGVLRLLRRPERFSQDERQGLIDNLHAVLDKAQKTAVA